ncbi:MAG: hypothetical protein ABIQ95_14625 [Bdellovibrionia bacterium]
MFFQFKKVEKESCVIVIEETGVLALDYTGKKAWGYPTDIIIDHQTIGSEVIVQTMDGNELRISITTGDVVS